jgi:hypothetical protein
MEFVSLFIGIYLYFSASRWKETTIVPRGNLAAVSNDFSVRWVPCHHSMARPRVADGGTASSYGG